MLRRQITKQLPALILLLTLLSVTQWLKITIANTFIAWFIYAWIIWIFVKYARSKYTVSHIDITYKKLLIVYFVWIAICILRGVVMCLEMGNYWIWKQLFAGTFALLLPTCIYVFSESDITQHVTRIWFKYALWIFLLITPFLPVDAYHFYLGPVILMGCFIPLLPKKWKIIVGVLVFVMLVGEFGARSQIIKAFVASVISVMCLFRRLISDKMIRIGHWTCYIMAIALLVLGISGRFNVFQDINESSQGKYTGTKMKDGQQVTEDYTTDTRTFIYVEVIESALDHNYVIWGRTPARGNDSSFFGDYMAEELKTGLYERHSNELVHTNVFTWAGIIGVILYALLYLRASWLAVYRSKNYYIKLLGVFVAFRWMYGWVEDFNRFDIMNISLWMMIAICCSTMFREMSDTDFEQWIKGVFAKRAQFVFNTLRLKK